jgi:hypothetical protein
VENDKIETAWGLLDLREQDERRRARPCRGPCQPMSVREGREQLSVNGYVPTAAGVRFDDPAIVRSRVCCGPGREVVGRDVMDRDAA